MVDLLRGEMIETALVGRDGAVGATEAFHRALSFSRAVVRVPGAALALSADRFRELHSKHADLRQIMAQYQTVLFAQTQQTSACNSVHPVEARLCRWLLQVRDLVGDEFCITHESIANLLGVQRQTISSAAHQLQDAGLIENRRAKIRIVDPNGVQSRACECCSNLTQYKEAALRPTASEQKTPVAQVHAQRAATSPPSVNVAAARAEEAGSRLNVAGRNLDDILLAEPATRTPTAEP